jgi:hypothetical protein
MFWNACCATSRDQGKSPGGLALLTWADRRVPRILSLLWRSRKKSLKIRVLESHLEISPPLGRGGFRSCWMYVDLVPLFLKFDSNLDET